MQGIEGVESTPVAPCCPVEEQSTCCAPEAKQACCGPEATRGGGCGCQPSANEPTKQGAADEVVRSAVREHYSQVAQSAAGCCGGGGCNASSLQLGYTEQDLASVPAGADLGLGCGNPHAIAAIRPGETVLDLGSGAGFDCFLAARQVGRDGRVVGVDMTPAMIDKARANAGKVGAANVEFRLGEIEHLPLPDASVDVVISNCVVNLSPEKPQVYREAFRVLRRGGRIAISDVVATQPLPPQVAADLAAHAGCVAGATPVDELRDMLAGAGFRDVRVVVRPESRVFIRDWVPGSGAEAFVASATIEAIRP